MTSLITIALWSPNSRITRRLRPWNIMKGRNKWVNSQRQKDAAKVLEFERNQVSCGLWEYRSDDELSIQGSTDLRCEMK